MPTYQRASDIDSWRTDPRIAERGYAHIWQSTVASGNGEDAFLDLIDSVAGPHSDVLDVGCGHGDLALHLATRCRSVVGVERIGGYLDLARELATERGIANIRFVQADLAGPKDSNRKGGLPRPFVPLPVPDRAVDVVVNRRGPMLPRYIDDLRRVIRPGGVLIGMHPNFAWPPPVWTDQLGQLGANLGAFPFEEIASWVTVPLDERNLTDYRLWWIDVPEDVPTPRDLYDLLPYFNFATDLPAFELVESEFQQVFEAHAGPEGLRLRHQRLLYRVGSIALD